jgi:hypothetical protein
MLSADLADHISHPQGHFACQSGPLWHVHHDPFTLLDRIEGAELWQLQPGRQGGSQLTLFGVPQQMVAEERPCCVLRVDVCGVGIGRAVPELPEDNRRTTFARVEAATDGGALTKREPRGGSVPIW